MRSGGEGCGNPWRGAGLWEAVVALKSEPLAARAWAPAWRLLASKKVPRTPADSRARPPREPYCAHPGVGVRRGPGNVGAAGEVRVRGRS